MASRLQLLCAFVPPNLLSPTNPSDSRALRSAIVARTYFVDPTPAQLRVYDAVLEAQAALIDKLRPGAIISAVVTAVYDQVRACRRLLSCCGGVRQVWAGTGEDELGVGRNAGVSGARPSTGSVQGYRMGAM